jgi:uncharacterized protein with PQ loop repeat
MEAFCHSDPIYYYVIGIIQCIFCIVSFLPQFYNFIKNRSIEGVSELTLAFLNLGSALLVLNSYILTDDRFDCYNECNWLLCTGNLLSFYQLIVGMLVILMLYVIQMIMIYI